MVVNLACYATRCIVRSPYECVYSRSHNFLNRRPKSRKLQQNMCEGMYVNIIDSFCHSDQFEKMTTLQQKCAQYRGQAELHF